MSARRTVFTEVMEGTLRLAGEDRDRPMRLELAADLPGVLRPWGDAEGALTGRVRVPGWADDPAASGRLRVAPLAARRIRYTLAFTAGDGRRLRLDGWKTASPRRPVRSMTFLPLTVTGEDGAVAGEARLRFDLRRDLARFLGGFRFPGPDPLRSRWRGQAGRLEVWYTTLTDPATGTGVWIHHELVAPAEGAADAGAARAHGWAAVFPPGEAPVLARFGPETWSPPRDAAFAAGSVAQAGGRLTGEAGALAWDLRESGGGRPLYTFPRWAWESELLPAAQIVPRPAALYDGVVRFGDGVLDLAAAPGASARVYGHGNARRWAWLHADLGGGDVCEIVAAVSTRPGMDRLPPLPFVRFRIDGADLTSGDPLLAALRLRARIGLPVWTVHGRIGDRRVHVRVSLPPGETVAVDYTDPDGAPAVCHNSERADVRIALARRAGRGWETEREWRLDGTGHAEVGLR
ncbi:hypothetical protein BKA00_000943 [Actinomadura coerulea]|uniref:Uncharacterized protein n=1 Tax=Actinomadura coerulea TaxID=46159 RepID=A0A7X0FUP5_9ACTN|nr:hypothetical protein [Actinomadura coerulea]MBB6394029.1 hypothetical protein [Actinomadura coerulea]GGQ19801.1 hypothetical protein GCM10010187_39980 [Actinomadura coerulea]